MDTTRIVRLIDGRIEQESKNRVEAMDLVNARFDKLDTRLTDASKDQEVRREKHALGVGQTVTKLEQRVRTLEIKTTPVIAEPESVVDIKRPIGLMAQALIDGQANKKQ